MPRSEKQKLKTLYVAKYLWEQTDENHGVTAAEIRDYLEEECDITAEEHSIYRDIAALRDEFGFDIDGGRGKKYRLASRDIDYDDLRTLSECVYATRFISEGQAARLVGLLGGFCSEHQRAALEGETFVGNRMRTEERSVLNNASEIRRAMNENRKISFKYVKATINNVKKTVSRKNNATYTVSPYCLLVNNGDFYLLAYSDWDSKIMTYRVDRMRNVRCHQHLRIGRSAYNEINMDTYLRRVFGMHGGECQRVVMEFDIQLLDTVVDRLGTENIIYHAEGKKHFVVNAEIEVSPQFYAWLFGFGNKAKIIAPPSVAEGMKVHLQEVSAIYEAEKDTEV